MDASGKSGTIIIAEDSDPNRNILQHLLEKLNFHVMACEDGAEAWKILEKAKGNPELIGVISDIMMPNMNGIELLKRIRNTTELANLPVILVTAVSDRDFILKAKDAHVSGYILKPLTHQKLVAKLKEIFPDREFPLLTGS